MPFCIQIYYFWYFPLGALTLAKSKKILATYRTRHFTCSLERLFETSRFLLNSLPPVSFPINCWFFWQKFYCEHIVAESELSADIWAVSTQRDPNVQIRLLGRTEIRHVIIRGDANNNTNHISSCHFVVSCTNPGNFRKCLKVYAYDLGGKFDSDEVNNTLWLTEMGQRKHLHS